MQLYYEIACVSRWIDPYDRHVCDYCWHCFYELHSINHYDMKEACDVDHILGRWWWENRNYENRMYDPKNLALLCRKHHQDKSFIGVDVLKKIVLSKLKYDTIEKCVSVCEALERKCSVAMKTLQDERL